MFPSVKPFCRFGDENDCVDDDNDGKDEADELQEEVASVI